jgi:hypothetical protein
MQTVVSFGHIFLWINTTDDHFSCTGSDEDQNFGKGAESHRARKLTSLI